MSMSSGLVDKSRMHAHVQDVSSGNPYDRNTEPDEQARLRSALFADPIKVAAGKIDTAPSVLIGL